jgi:hypothetical protein
LHLESDPVSLETDFDHADLLEWISPTGGHSAGTRTRRLTRVRSAGRPGVGRRPSFSLRKISARCHLALGVGADRPTEPDRAPPHVSTRPIRTKFTVRPSGRRWNNWPN